MKRNLTKLIIAAFLVIAPILTFAQPPHPNGGGLPPGVTNQPVGGAPVGNGTYILLVLALAYAGKKVYDLRTTTEEE